MKIKLRSVYDSFPEKYGKSDKQINFCVDNNVYYMDNTDRNEEEAIAMAIVALEKAPEYLAHIDHQRQYITKLEEYIATNIPEWILIKDRLPDERQKVLL